MSILWDEETSPFGINIWAIIDISSKWKQVLSKVNILSNTIFVSKTEQCIYKESCVRRIKRPMGHIAHLRNSFN